MLRLFFSAVFLVAFVGLCSGTATPKCTKPSVRKEWRALGHDGQKAFADAIKASILLTSIYSTMDLERTVFSRL